MIYLDYSATTPVNKEVLDTFNKASIDFVGNANSLHKLGFNAYNLIENASMQIKSILNIKDAEIIYTSSSSEANNLAIKGLALKYQNRGKHIISTLYEHSSVNETLLYLKKLGFTIDYVQSKVNGLIDLDNLKSLIRKDTILVIVNAINSEIGIRQNIEEIGSLLKNYNCFYFVDLTQAIGKIKVDLTNVDLASFSAHKFYGLKGIGCLIKKNNIELIPLIHGGKSTTIYRSGTPAHPLIASLSKALRLSYENFNEKYNYVVELNNYLKEKLKKYDFIKINSNDDCIPHILNISVKGIKAETLMHALEKDDIFISTKSACSDIDSMSESVYALTNDKDLAKSSIRISLSYLTTKQEIDTFVTSLINSYQSLHL